MSNKNVETFIVYIAFFSLEIKIIIYLAEKTQIISLGIEEVLKNILTKYLDFKNMFIKQLTLNNLTV